MSDVWLWLAGRLAGDSGGDGGMIDGDQAGRQGRVDTGMAGGWLSGTGWLAGWRGAD